MIKFKYYGHACFLLETDNEKLLFDPFLTGNPVASISADEEKCDYILLTHAHGDHYGDATQIAQKTGAKVISTPEVLTKLPSDYENVHGMNLGGSFTFPFGIVTMVPALHSAGVEGGIPCGFVIKFNDDTVVYFAGDTALFSDMALIGEKQQIDYAILPIGSNYTMDAKDAAKAVQLLNAKHAIPVHYNTWPVIAENPEAFKSYAESISHASVDIVPVGSSLDLVK